MTEPTIRDIELRRLLTARQRELQTEVHSQIRDGRTDHTAGVGDALEHSDADIQDGIEYTLLQMRAETLARIDEALLRLDGGQYGSCRDCGSEIAERRLQALPFAVRCQACEARREQDGATRRIAQQRGGRTLFPDLVSS